VETATFWMRPLEPACSRAGKRLGKKVVGLGRVELATNGLGKQIAVLTGSENSRLYYVGQEVPMTTT
jgi:hypothetical protein